MLKIMTLFNKRVDMKLDAFQQYWATDHAKLICGLPRLRKYKQNVTVGGPEQGPSYDGVDEFRFDNAADFAAALESAAGKNVRIANDKVLGLFTQVCVEERTIMQSADYENAKAPFKQVSALTKRFNISSDEFIQYWTHTHADLVQRLPGLIRYVINIPQWQPGIRPTFDGLVELWFQSRTAFEGAFTSEAGKLIPGDNANFMGRTDRAFVEERILLSDHVGSN